MPTRRKIADAGKVEEAIKAVGRVPDVVYDLGEVGKEPMIRVWETRRWMWWKRRWLP